MEPINNYIIYVTSQEGDWLIITATIFTAVAALITAAIGGWALRFSNKQLAMHDKNNRLMVKPNLDGGTHIDIHKQKLTYKITNSGIGPAIIKKTTIILDQKIIDKDDPIDHVVKELVPGIDTHDFGHQTIAVGSYFPASAAVELFTISCDDYCKVEELLQDLEEKAQIIIHYQSVYEEDFIFDSRA